MNTTFTNYAEKKAKQFFNLLQGYTKGIRITAILILLLMGVSNAWAAINQSNVDLYFDNSTSKWTNCYVYIGHDSHTSCYAMTRVSGTQYLWKLAKGWNNGNSWDGASGWVVSKEKWWDSNSENVYKFVYHGNNNVTNIRTSVWDATTIYKANGTTSVTHFDTKCTVYNWSTSTKSDYTVTINSPTGGTLTVKDYDNNTVSSGASKIKLTVLKFSASASTGYTFGGVQINNGSTTTTIDATDIDSETYTLTSNVTITPIWTENTYAVTISAGSGGTVSPSGSKTIGQVTTTAVTATPDANYEFVNWTATGGVVVANTTAASTTITATAAGTLKANFRSTATNSLTVAAGAGIASVTGSKDPVTLGNTFPITATPKTGYTFSTWTANPVANATFESATTANTTVTVKNGSVIVTASATENMSTLTTSNQYDAGDPGYEVPTASVNSIGYETTATVTATAAGNGYTFTGWTLTNCTRTDGGADNATSITVRSNGDGKAATVVALYNENLTSEWHLVGNGNIFPDGWNINNTSMMQKISGKSTEDVVAMKINVTTVQTYEFKIVDDNGSNSNTWYGYSTGNTFLTWTETSTKNVYSGDGNANNLRFTPNVAGEYEFKVDYSGTYPAVTITYPTIYTVNYSQTPAAAADAPTTSPSVTSGNSVVAGTSVTFTAKDAKPGYAWEGWYDNSEGTGTALSTDKAYERTINNNTTIYAVYTEILSTITIVTNPAEGGSVKVDGEDFVSGNTVQVGVATTKQVTAVPNEGYGVAAWGVSNQDIVNASGGTTVTLKSDGSGSTGTLTANFIGLEYTITFDKQEGTEGTDNVTVRYKNNNYSISPVVAPTRTGYTFGGYYTEAAGAGVQVVSAEGQWLANATGYTDTDGKWVRIGDAILYAKWTANTYTVTLDQEGAAEKGDASATATYDAALPQLTKVPTAQNGYAFMGYWDGKDGTGTQYYNAGGTSEHAWDKAENATLYAHFAKAEITQITLDKYTFEPVEAGGTGFVTATPTIEPIPTGTVILCWRLLYNNGNEVPGRSAQVVSGNIVKFSIAGLAAGTYKIEAVLRTGNNCGSGEVLSTKTVNFSIASSYTITVRYTCNGKEIAIPAKVSASVTEETEITAPNITGYTFSSWEAGDGVTIKSTNGNSVYITAIYDGYLTAKYTARPMVYFKNTLGWEKVYVYTFWDNAWWNDSGTGVHPATNKLEQGEMTRIGETDIYYFALTNPDGDYTQNNNANPNYIAFSNVDYRNDNGAFRSGQAIYRGDHKERLTLFVPQKDQTPETHNSTKYYSKGIWMEYNSTESGYQLAGEVPSDDPDPNHDGWGTYGNKFTAQQPGNYIFTITKHLEANTTYKFKIKNAVWIKDYSNKDNNQWFGYEGTISNSTTNWLHFKGDNDEGKNNGDAKITTTAAGEYTFTIDLSQGKVLLSVEYPIEVGDYRVIYKDNATWSKGTAHDANWYHPSRIIKKNKTAEPTKDIISFFISYGQNTTMQFQRVKSITNGNVTWENAGEARIPDAVKEAGVYNFIVTQAANGASISMEDNAEPYTGNYYIRVDALAGKWDNYKTTPENRMTYSAFSESEANSFGEKFSHYATKYCTNGTNIKFTIANDYSPCISDTLVQDVVNPLGNLDSEGTLLSNDMYNANVRFMWYRKTNKISRAYVGPAGDKQSQFLMLRTNVEMQDAAGALDAAEGDIIDAGKSIYAARFADTQNWIYERTVKVKPGTRVKLYASYPKCYHIYVENNTGWDEVALYAWKDNDNHPLGNWPGLKPARTVEIDGNIYHDFHVNEWVFGSNLILNNNGKGSQLEDYKIGDAGNYYLTITNGTLALKDDGYKAITPEANAQYFRGTYANNDWSNENTVEILGGSTGDWQTIRVIYDFKTNRLMRAWVPSGDISGDQAINADLMIIRKHQEDATCITFADNSSKLSEVKTVYGTLQFNRWVLNNRNSEKAGLEYCTREDNNQKVYDEGVVNTHHPVLSTGEQKSIYERALYFISFPFDVHLSDVFGFGTYGTHWVISDYNGLRRAQRGYFAEDCINEDCTNWDYIWDPSDFKLEANKGYLLSLDLELMRYDNTDFWLHNIDQVELFFPSTANLATIEKTSYTMSALDEEYLCKINHNTDGTTPDRDRRVKDSYWRCIGVPSFANYDGSLYKSKEDAEANEGAGKYPINWKDDYTWTADESGFPFLYEWNVTDNSLSVQNTSAYQFKPTFAYLVQNGDAIYWKAVNTKPSTQIIARQRTEADRNYEWKIALLRNGNQEDQTFVRITDNENVTTAFDFNQDLAKEFNYGRGDIYTLIGYERVAANSMPCSDKTTIIPLGLNIEQAGDYTIAMPEGVENIGITLVDNETGIHTNLSAGQEYTLTLNNGICENRLFIEVSPIQNTPTDLEYTTGDTREQTTRKVLINEKLYIIRDGVVYDAQGKRL